MTTRRGPIVIEHDEPAESFLPSEAPPIADEAPPEGAAMQSVVGILARPVSWISRLFWSALTGLIGIIISVAAWDYVNDLLSRNLILARITTALLAVVALGLAIVVIREIAAMARLRRIDSLQEETARIRASGNAKDALRLSRHIDSFYAGREELRWNRASLAEQRDNTLDADAILDQTEAALILPLDALARRQIESAARQVAGATALIPLPMADVAVALAANVRMVRRIAFVYGGRSGFFGSWRLLRAVATHLLATGVVAVGDDMIGSLAGGGILAKISRRFGEGVINGALTARVGIAAMEVCRPMPFHVAKRPGVSSITGTALKGLFNGKD